jgi:hypothetical protein
MYRIIAAFFLLVASVATSSAQPALFPSVWQNPQGSLLKVLATDPSGSFRGVFINYGPPCPGAVYDVAGAVRGPLIGFQTWKAWSFDCRATTVWRGRMINPTTVVVKWTMTYGGRTVRGTDTFRRI